MHSTEESCAFLRRYSVWSAPEHPVFVRGGAEDQICCSAPRGECCRIRQGKATLIMQSRRKAKSKKKTRND